MLYATNGCGGLYTGNYIGTGRMGSNGYNNNRTMNSSHFRRIERDLSYSYDAQMAMLQRYIASGDKKNALKIYDELFDDVNSNVQCYGLSGIDDSQIATLIDKVYEEKTGSSFVDSVSKGTRNPFTCGMMQGVPIFGLFAETHNTEEVFDKIQDKKPSLKQEIKEIAGSLIPGSLIGLAGGLVKGSLAKAALAIVGASTPILPVALGGLAIGAAVGLGQKLIKNVIDGCK